MQPDSLIAADTLNELAEELRRAPAGAVVEIGVYKGGSAAILAGVCREQGRDLWLFDTFKGEPYSNVGDFHRKGDFGDTSLDEVSAAIPDAHFVVGVFPGTLKQAVAEGLGKIALAHIDCDQYRSIKACCEHLGPRMLQGGVMVFDDYDALENAHRAVDEVFGDRVRLSARGKARVYF